MMRLHFLPLAVLAQLLTSAQAQTATKIPISPITPNTFADPYPIQQTGQGVYIAGTTHSYLHCSGALAANCASQQPPLPITFNYTSSLLTQAKNARTTICGWYNLNPLQTVSGSSKTWDAAVTLRVKNTTNTADCANTAMKGWSVIAHARATGTGDVPPTSWTGDIILVGSLSQREGANYDGKYFRTPAGQLYLVYQKLYQVTPQPARDGVAAWPLDNPSTKKAGSSPTFLLKADDGTNALKSQDWKVGDDGNKVIETGNIRAINGKFVMVYSTGFYNRKTYKTGLAWSDTFLPAAGQTWRKVMKANPNHLYGSQGAKKVLYMVQSDNNVTGWNYVGDQVLAPGVGMVANIGPDKSWMFTFAGYSPGDAKPDKTGEYTGSRRPFLLDLNVNVPTDKKVTDVSDEELQRWIVPVTVPLNE